MLNVKKTLTKILDALKTDYVVDEAMGTNSGYRKWASGKAEYWLHQSSSGGIGTSVWTAPIYYQDSTSWTNIWGHLFVSAPQTVNVTTHESQLFTVYPYNITQTGCTLRFLSVGAKSNQGYNFSIYAQGKWK